MPVHHSGCRYFGETYNLYKIYKSIYILAKKAESFDSAFFACFVKVKMTH